jgi:two-component system response regulator YesN
MHTLLIVDDEPEISYGLSRLFPWKDVGFNVVKVTENGKQAFDYIQEHQVDAVLCDIKMPIMDGLELLEALNELKISVHFIFISGYKDFEIMRKAIVLGANDFIAKPTSYEELYAVFQNAARLLDVKREKLTPPPVAGEEPVGRRFDYQSEMIDKVKEYMESHYAMANLNEAARIVHLNPQYLSKFFKEKTGVNFSEYLTEIKMNAAIQLLQDIRFKTYEVGNMVGYVDPKNFTKAFRKHFGISPREYRNGQDVQHDE